MQLAKKCIFCEEGKGANLLKIEDIAQHIFFQGGRVLFVRRHVSLDIFMAAFKRKMRGDEYFLIPCYSHVWGQIQVAMLRRGQDLFMIVFTSMRHWR